MAEVVGTHTVSAGDDWGRCARTARGRRAEQQQQLQRIRPCVHGLLWHQLLVVVHQRQLVSSADIDVCPRMGIRLALRTDGSMHQVAQCTPLCVCHGLCLFLWETVGVLVGVKMLAIVG